MDDIGDILEVLLEDPQGVGVRYHYSRDFLVHRIGHRLRVEQAVRAGLDRHDLVVARGR